MKYLMGQKDERQFRVVGITLFAAWCGLVIMRILMRYIPVTDDLAADAVFTLPVQLGLLLILPYCMYRFGLNMKPREVLAFSNVRKCRTSVLLLSIPLGFVAFFVTIGVSSVWQSLLVTLGYTHSSSATVYPEKFNFFLFLASLTLTAVLPAICEEFAVRGGLLTVVGKAFRPEAAVLIMGLAFGLFHQNITQFFYTALFGTLMAYIAYRHKSILPCMIIHFLNNGAGVYLDYAEAYGWWGHNLYDWINAHLQTDPFTVVTLYLLICAIGGMLVFFIHNAGKPKDAPARPAHPAAPAQDAPRVNVNPFADLGIDPFAPRGNSTITNADPDGVFGPATAPVSPDIAGETPPGSPPAPDAAANSERFSPTWRDGAFYAGAIALSVLTTVFTFIWGLF